MVIYALVAQESVGRLFLGGAIPGLMIGLIMLGITIGISYWKKYPREEIRFSGKEKLVRVRQSALAIVMPVFVVGSVVLGIATATESAGIGVLYALVVGLLIIRGLKLKDILPILKSAVVTSATVMIIIALSQLYVWILAIEKIPQLVSGFVTGLPLPGIAILLSINLIILLTGTFVDVSPAILLLTPVFLPAVQALGVSSIQFGAILICGLAVGLVTPPVGMCLNVASTISRLGIGRIFKAALPLRMESGISFFINTLLRADSGPPLPVQRPGVPSESIAPISRFHGWGLR